MNEQLPLDTVIHGDCVDVMSRFPADSIDLCITSPPYDDLRTYHGFTLDVPAVARQLYRVLKSGGIVVWIVADAIDRRSRSRTGASKRHALALEAAGLRSHDDMIYRKLGIRYGDRTRYSPTFEYMWAFRKGQRPATVKLIWDRPNKTAGQIRTHERRERDGSRTKTGRVRIREFGVRTNVWSYPTGGRLTAPDNLFARHPAVMPLALAEDHIISWSQPGQIVLDCFSGSGQVLVAAAIRGRRYIGVDCSAEYCDLARERLALYDDCMCDDFLNAFVRQEEELCAVPPKETLPLIATSSSGEKMAG